MLFRSMYLSPSNFNVILIYYYNFCAWFFVEIQLGPWDKDLLAFPVILITTSKILTCTPFVGNVPLFLILIFLFNILLENRSYFNQIIGVLNDDFYQRTLWCNTNHCVTLILYLNRKYFLYFRYHKSRGKCVFFSSNFAFVTFVAIFYDYVIAI